MISNDRLPHAFSKRDVDGAIASYSEALSVANLETKTRFFQWVSMKRMMGFEPRNGTTFASPGALDQGVNLKV
jgi:hypothetical protein